MPGDHESSSKAEQNTRLVKSAVEDFWNGRLNQADKQRLSGRIDAGARGAVTGGGHLDGIRDLIAELFVDAGLPATSIRRKAGIVLPGFYRPTKEWDLLVVQDDVLVAAIELKSQVGPSFSNNFNNRIEEAIGNAVDVWRAYEEGTFGAVRPWLGYVFLLEEAVKSTSKVALPSTVYPVESVFEDTSYKDRYGIFCDRLVKERMYDATWFFTATSAGLVDEPRIGLSFANFAAAIAGRCAYIKTLSESR